MSPGELAGQEPRYRDGGAAAAAPVDALAAAPVLVNISLEPTTVEGVARAVTVDLIIHLRIERCPGPYTLGDLVYTTSSTSSWSETRSGCVVAGGAIGAICRRERVPHMAALTS